MPSIDTAQLLKIVQNNLLVGKELHPRTRTMYRVVRAKYVKQYGYENWLELAKEVMAEPLTQRVK